MATSKIDDVMEDSHVFKDGEISFLVRRLIIKSGEDMEIRNLQYVEGEKEGRILQDVKFFSFSKERQNTLYLSELNLSLNSDHRYFIEGIRI